MSEQLKQSLRNHKIRPTEIRENILALFVKSNHALSHSDIQTHLKSTYDRVTLYRTLNTFEEKGLIHKVVDSQGITNFALCKSGCVDRESHRDEHLHFQCKSCGHTFCLHKVPLPPLEIPGGFRLDDLIVRAEGICGECGK